MNNGTDSLLETYLFETNTLLEQLDELLIDAEQNGDFTEDNVNEIFRSMHTIKGSSAMLEFDSLMEIAHHIEDLFFYIRENGMHTLSADQKSELFNLMFSSTDKLREEVAKVENNEPLDTNIDSFIENINGFLNKISDKKSGEETASEESGGSASAGAGDSSAATELNSPYLLHLYFDEGCGMENLRAFMIVTSIRETDIPFHYYPADIETNSDTSEYIIENGFYLGFQSEADTEKAVSHISAAGNVHSYEILNTAELQKKKEEEEAAQEKAGAQQAQKAEAAGGAAKPSADQKAKATSGASTHHTPAKQSLISVNLSKLDSLMAIVGEIVIAESMVTSSPELKNLKLDNFLKSARQLRKLTDDLQDISMSLRMVSVSSVFQKMNRVVRDMSKTLKKNVKLTIIGENTEVDKTIVDNIGDPIMHIVRNAMDHGIEETEEERIAAGKKAQGEIILAAEHTGSEVIISVTDDGYGVDPEKILAKAAANGILTKPEEEYTKKEVLSLLMMPGFSTNTEVTEYSGRGVGMDVVKRNVENIGGVINIDSEKGEGSVFTLKIPLTLAIVDGMVISIGGDIFTVPITNIRQSFKAKETDIMVDAAGNEMIRCMDDYYPVVRLHELYGIPNACTAVDDGILMWVEGSDKSYCMLVDQLIGEQQVVVKPLPGYLSNFGIKNSGISGCTIMGDGNISIILDVANLYYAAQNTY